VTDTPHPRRGRGRRRRWSGAGWGGSRRLIAKPPIAAPQAGERPRYSGADGVTLHLPLAERRVLSSSWPACAPPHGPCWPRLAAGQAGRRGAGTSPAGRATHHRCGCSSSRCTWAVPPGWLCRFAPRIAGSFPRRERTRPMARGQPPRRPTDPDLRTASVPGRRRIERARNGPRRHTSGRRLNEARQARAGGGEDTPRVRGRDEPGPWQPRWDARSAGGFEELPSHSVVELDYGGLVHLLDDDSLRADQSVAEVSAEISASGRPETRHTWRRVYQAAPQQVQALEYSSRQLTIRGRLARFPPVATIRMSLAHAADA